MYIKNDLIDYDLQYWCVDDEESLRISSWLSIVLIHKTARLKIRIRKLRIKHRT
jgi:hypothetical protein